MSEDDYTAHIEYCDAWGEAHGIGYSTWSVGSEKNLDDECPLQPEGQIIRGSHWWTQHPLHGAQFACFSAPVQGNTWGDVWMAVDEVFRQMQQAGRPQGVDHRFIEGVEERDGVLEFSTGS